MKKAGIVVCTLFFVSAAGLAEMKSPTSPSAPSPLPRSWTQPPSRPPAPPAEANCASPQGKPAPGATPQTEVLFAAWAPVTSQSCSAQTTCWDGSVVSCQLMTGTCTSSRSDCYYGLRGSVNCNGTVTYCPPCPCGTLWCCQCQSMGDCYTCCRCSGGSFSECDNLCYGGS